MLPRTAWLELDLDALTANLAAIRRRVGPGVAIHPAVKADAYGHGAVPIARALERAGADGFCVATWDEAIELRDGGVSGPILVMFPIPPAWATDAARRGIGLTVGEAALLEGTLGAAGAAGADGPPLSLQLEVETGLGRGGLAGDALIQAARRIAAASVARLDGIWTHFQAAEDPAITTDQVRRFEAATTSLREAGIQLPARHAAASGALVLDGTITLDAVRPGLSIYGLVPDELLDRPEAEAGLGADLGPVLALYARPVRVVDLPEGWGVSYGPTWRAPRPSRIATLPIGYGDGWPRSLSNRREALVRGLRVPLVGNVAMDAVMADVTDVPGAPVTIADEFVLIGAQGGARIRAAEVARSRTTNSWEVVTNMARRVPRVYHAASGPEGVRTLVSRGLG